MANKIILFVVCLFTVSCTQKSNFVAQVDGWGNDTVIAIYHAWGSNSEICDTIVAVDGHIEYNTPVMDTVEVLFTAKKSMYPRGGRPLLMESRSIQTIMTPLSKEHIKGKLADKLLKYKSTGSKFYAENSKIRAQYLPHQVAIDSLNILIEDSGKNKFTGEQINALFDQRNEKNDEIRSVKLEYIKANMSSDLAAYLLVQQPDDIFIELIQKLSPEVRNGFYRSQISSREQYIEMRKKTQEAKLKVVVGAEAPNFTLTSLDGTTKSLSDFKGKWVIIDFWGSWCGWCIKGFPQLKEAYAQYNGKLEIIGIDCNETEEVWRKSVAEQKLNWVQVINATEVDKSASVMYGIEGYPTKLIITPDQKIANITVGDDPKFYVTLEKLIK